jgi:hypothetical protein
MNKDLIQRSNIEYWMHKFRDFEELRLLNNLFLRINNLVIHRDLFKNIDRKMLKIIINELKPK